MICHAPGEAIVAGRGVCLSLEGLVSFKKSVESMRYGDLGDLVLLRGGDHQIVADPGSVLW